LPAPVAVGFSVSMAARRPWKSNGLVADAGTGFKTSIKASAKLVAGM
jgi:hypothetical protein